MPRVVHFEIAADQPERASKFYKDVFDWNIQKWEGPQDYWLVTTGKEGEMGINGGIMQRPDPATRTINTIDVSSVDEFTEKIAASGGSVVMPKMAVPGIGWLAYCQDTEQNVFGIMQGDPSAQ